MPRALLLVDPQNDFISGTLPVPGAMEAMTALARQMLCCPDRYDLKLVTLDFHPWNHCSFTDQGGSWPRHCVAWFQGAAILESLTRPLYQTPGTVHILPKGRASDREEYSAFQSHSQRIADLLAGANIQEIDICGLAGDVCVLQTLRDGMAALPHMRWNVLAEFAPSLDGGNALKQFCLQEGVCIR